MFGPDILEVRTLLHFKTECLIQMSKIDVYTNRVVCRAYFLDAYHDLSAPAFSFPIHWTSPEFLR